MPHRLERCRFHSSCHWLRQRIPPKRLTQQTRQKQHRRLVRQRDKDARSVFVLVLRIVELLKTRGKENAVIGRRGLGGGGADQRAGCMNEPAGPGFHVGSFLPSAPPSRLLH